MYVCIGRWGGVGVGVGGGNLNFQLTCTCKVFTAPVAFSGNSNYTY